MKKKALLFFTYLPPWRIDVFNEIARQYDLKIIFANIDAKGFVYNQSYLLSKLQAPVILLKYGLKIKERVFRFWIINTLIKHRPEVVFTHEYSPTSVLLATLVRLRLFSFKLVVTTSDNVRIAQEAGWLKRYFRKYVLQSSNGLIVYSESVKKWYEHIFTDISIGVCPNIQNPKTLLEKREDKYVYVKEIIARHNITKPIVLYVGRLENVKGLDLLIKAYAYSIVDTHDLVLVGEGREKEYLIQKTEEFGIKESVIFAGYYDVPNLYSWYEIADFLVLPSWHEPFGAVVNEALIYGCPVVASKYVGAITFVDEPYNGLIFDPHDSKGFEEILIKACQYFPRAKIGRESLMRHSFDEYVNVFTELID